MFFSNFKIHHSSASSYRSYAYICVAKFHTILVLNIGESFIATNFSGKYLATSSHEKSRVSAFYIYNTRIAMKNNTPSSSLSRFELSHLHVHGVVVTSSYFTAMFPNDCDADIAAVRMLNGVYDDGTWQSASIAGFEDVEIHHLCVSGDAGDADENTNDENKAGFCHQNDPGSSQYEPDREASAILKASSGSCNLNLYPLSFIGGIFDIPPNSSSSSTFVTTKRTRTRFNIHHISLTNLQSASSETASVFARAVWFRTRTFVWHGDISVKNILVNNVTVSVSGRSNIPAMQSTAAIFAVSLHSSGSTLADIRSSLCPTSTSSLTISNVRVVNCEIAAINLKDRPRSSFFIRGLLVGEGSLGFTPSISIRNCTMDEVSLAEQPAKEGSVTLATIDLGPFPAPTTSTTSSSIKRFLSVDNCHLNGSTISFLPSSSEEQQQPDNRALRCVEFG